MTEGYDWGALKICVIGSANSDLILEVKKAPQPGETIKARASHFKLGGKVYPSLSSISILGS